MLSGLLLRIRELVYDGCITDHPNACLPFSAEGCRGHDAGDGHKLELSAAGASSLLEKNPFGQSPTILRRRSVYFDTVEGDLSKRGLSLRIRQCGEESIERYPRRLFSISAVVSAVGSSGLILGREFVGSNWIFPMHSRED